VGVPRHGENKTQTHSSKSVFHLRLRISSGIPEKNILDSKLRLALVKY